MEEQKSGSAAGRLAVALVELINSCRRGGEQLVIARDAFALRVEPVREQGEPQVSLAVAQIVDF